MTQVKHKGEVGFHCRPEDYARGCFEGLLQLEMHPSAHCFVIPPFSIAVRHEEVDSSIISTII